MSDLPDSLTSPTVAEAGMPEFRVAISKEIIAKINAGLVKAGNSPDVRDRLSAIGVKLQLSTPEEFGAFFRAEQKRWGDIIVAEKIKLD